MPAVGSRTPSSNSRLIRVMVPWVWREAERVRQGPGEAACAVGRGAPSSALTQDTVVSQDIPDTERVTGIEPA